MESLSITIATEQSTNGNTEKSISEAFHAVFFVFASKNFLVSVLSTEFNKNAWPPVVSKLSLYRPEASVVIHAQILPEARYDSFQVVFHAGEDGSVDQIQPVFDEFLNSVRTHHPWLSAYIIQ